MAAIVIVWSSFGHRFQSTGEYRDDAMRESYERCLTCGAEFVLVPRSACREESSGDYQASDGSDPVECSGDTGQCHGEQPCRGDGGHPCNDRGEGEPCSHESHDCNCLLCAG